MDQTIPLICFTDGSCSDQTRKIRTAGYSVVWPDDEEHNECASLTGNIITNNRAEFTALIRAIEIADIIDPLRVRTLVVHTDSMLLINSVSKWLHGWKKNNWIKADKKPVLNKDLLEKIDRLLEVRRVTFKHVKAHTGKKDWESQWNAVADQMAKDAHFKIHDSASVKQPTILSFFSQK